MKQTKGITLIALVVTIVVLLILAGVSINVLFGESGIINKARSAQEKWNSAKQKEEEDIKTIDDIANKYTDANYNLQERPKITDSTLTSEDRIKTESKTVIAQDLKGNQVVVPGGFKVSDDSGDTVQKGIVIEDNDGNQFVWVPVSNINKDGSNKIIKDDGSKVEITLGRYKFDDNNADIPGNPNLVQMGANYADAENKSYKIANYYFELNKYRESNEINTSGAVNTTAKNLKSFVEQTQKNKGFYIARFEASYASGYNEQGTDTKTRYEKAKPMSKISEANSIESMQYKKGTLWNFISQPQAAMVSRNMYQNNKYVESDLVNSYVWNTTILYIQEMGNTNYANQISTNNTLKDTGKTEDQKCKIYDMAGNANEWTTEYTTRTVSGNHDVGLCCSVTGGCFDTETGVSYRGEAMCTSTMNTTTFRTFLYVK